MENSSQIQNIIRFNHQQSVSLTKPPQNIHYYTKMQNNNNFNQIPSNNVTLDKTFEFIDQNIEPERIYCKEENCPHTRKPQNTYNPQKDHTKQEGKRKFEYSSQYTLAPFHFLMNGLKNEFNEPLSEYLRQQGVDVFIKPLAFTAKDVITMNEIIIIEVKNQTKMGLVETTLNEFLKPIKKDNPGVLVLELGCHFKFRHSHQLKNAFVISCAISQEDGIAIHGKIMRFPKNMIVAAAYRIFFYKLGFDISVENPQSKALKLAQQPQLTEILERERNFLLRYGYTQFDVIKKVYSSEKPQLKGVQSLVYLRFTSGVKYLQISFKSCLECSFQLSLT